MAIEGDDRGRDGPPGLVALQFLLRQLDGPAGDQLPPLGMVPLGEGRNLFRVVGEVGEADQGRGQAARAYP